METQNRFTTLSIVVCIISYLIYVLAVWGWSLYHVWLHPQEVFTFFRWLIFSRISYLQTVFVLAILYAVFHRILGFVLGMLVRRLLRKSLSPEHSNTYDIHFGWASVRGFLDWNEIVISDAVWRNPPKYNKTPFLLHIKQLSVSFHPWRLYHNLVHDNTLAIERVILDTVEVHFEKPMKVEGDEVHLNFWAALGVSTEDREKSMFSKIFNFLTHKIRTRFFTINFKHNRDNEDDDEDDEESDAAKVETSSSASSREREETGTGSEPSVASEGKRRSTGSKPFRMDVGRLIVLDLLAHPLDLLSSTHIEPFKSSDIKLKCFFMTRKELTGPPKEPGGDREPLLGDAFGDAFGDKFGSMLLSQNAGRITNLLSSTKGIQSLWVKGQAAKSAKEDTEST